jgi:hypothetical protein
MAADDWKIYDSFKEKMADGTVDLDDAGAGVFKCALFTDALTPAQTDDLYSALSDEVAAANGYTTGGEALTGITWTEAAGTATWDADDVVFTASGGSIVCRYAIIYHVASSQLVAMSLLDNSPADVTVTDGNTLTLQLDAAGIFASSGGW